MPIVNTMQKILDIQAKNALLGPFIIWSVPCIIYRYDHSNLYSELQDTYRRIVNTGQVILPSFLVSVLSATSEDRLYMQSEHNGYYRPDDVKTIKNIKNDDIIEIKQVYRNKVRAAQFTIKRIYKFGLARYLDVSTILSNLELGE